MAQKKIEPTETDGNDKANRLVQLYRLTDKTNPKPEDLAELKRALDEKPVFALTVGNLQKQVFESIVEKATGSSAGVKECVIRYIEHLKSELGYEKASFAERLLIDEIAMRWVRLQVMEHDHKKITYDSHTLAIGLYTDKRLHLAQQRFLRAVESLAKVRKLIVGTQAKGVQMYKNLVSAEG